MRRSNEARIIHFAMVFDWALGYFADFYLEVLC